MTNNSLMVSEESTRYALTRFPFPPFIARFKNKNIDLGALKTDLYDHFKKQHEQDTLILNCRLSTSKCNKDEVDVLIYVSDTASFTGLLVQSNWPTYLANENYVLLASPPIPPQLSLVMKHVDLNTDMNALTLELQQLYPEIKNVIRLKNKFGQDIHLVKLELTSANVRNQLLDAKKLKVNYMIHEIAEFLAPVNVLICTKCCGLGHFRRQCTEALETCRNCSQSVQDLKLHKCSSESKCKHCNGSHQANSSKCPVIKSYRASLTQKLLSSQEGGRKNRPNGSGSGRSYADVINTSMNNLANKSAPQFPSQDTMMSKIDDLIKGLETVNSSLLNLCNANRKFESFIVEKNERDAQYDEELERLNVRTIDLESKAEVGDLELQQLTSAMNSFLPILEDLVLVASSLSKDRQGRQMDNDLRTRLSQHRIQITTMNQLLNKSK
jgi:hypothetical protein